MLDITLAVASLQPRLISPPQGLLTFAPVVPGVVGHVGDVEDSAHEKNDRERDQVSKVKPDANSKLLEHSHRTARSGGRSEAKNRWLAIIAVGDVCEERSEELNASERQYTVASLQPSPCPVRVQPRVLLQLSPFGLVLVIFVFDAVTVVVHDVTREREPLKELPSSIIGLSCLTVEATQEGVQRNADDSKKQV